VAAFKGSKLSAKDEATNIYILKLLEEGDALFRTYKHQTKAYRDSATQERILMLTKDSWFMRVTDPLRMRCL
jgi:hypothetical protein